MRRALLTLTSTVATGSIFRTHNSRSLPLRAARTFHLCRQVMSSSSSASTERLVYPTTRRSDHVDHYHGTAVPDPYDWLENPDSPETAAWVEAQNAVTQRFLSISADRPLLKERLLQLYNYERYSCPFHRGNRYFFFRNDGLQNQSVLYKQETLDAAESVLLDPNALSDDGTAALGTYAFSEDGQWLAYGVSRSGSDWQTIELLRVEDGAVQQTDSLRWVKFSSVAWTHDHAGFFYSRYPTPASFVGAEEDADHRKGSETDKLEHHSVYYHRLHTTQAEDVLVFATPHQPKWMNSAEVSDDGRFLLLSISESTEPVNRLYFHRLPASLSFGLQAAIPESGICRLVDTFDNEYSYVTNEGSRFFFKTNLQAPRYRIVSTDVDSWTAAGAAEAAAVQWTEVIEHKEDVLSFVSCVNQTDLVTVYMHNVSECIHLYGLDGRFRSTIDMPDLGCVAGLSGRKKDSRVDLAASSSSSSPPAPSLFRETKLSGFTASDYKTEQVWYNSKDGTRVPMFIISSRALPTPPASPLPVHLYGYGGFNIALTPSFAVSRLIWLQHFGGVYAVANIRGGGEFGMKWWAAGTKANKQNCFDDFIAAASYLIDSGYTSPSLLSISGGSNGGLLVGACINQRPDLFAAAVAAVGVMDMLKYDKFTIGYAWRSDYGSSDDSEAFQWLLRISPVHNVQQQQPYPALLLTTGDHDDRVVPLHSYKFISQLQAAWGGREEQQGKPLLIRIETRAGHGAGMPLTKRIEEQADVYAFLSKAMGIQLKW